MYNPVNIICCSTMASLYILPDYISLPHYNYLSIRTVAVLTFVLGIRRHSWRAAEYGYQTRCCFEVFGFVSGTNPVSNICATKAYDISIAQCNCLVWLRPSADSTTLASSCRCRRLLVWWRRRVGLLLPL